MLPKMHRDRFARYQEAIRFFKRLFPGLGYARFARLVHLAVEYWEKPERYA